MSVAQIKRIRRFLAWSFLKLALAAAAIFALARVVVPGLVNAHNDTMGLLGLLFALAAPVAVGWLVVSLFISGRHFIRQLGDTE